MKVNNLVIVSDTHCGCQFGLCPANEIALDGGGYYMPSILQQKVYEWWKIFWNDWVPVSTRNEPYAVCVNGDMVEGDHHGAKTPISININDQKHIAMELFEPIIDRCAKDETGKPLFFMVRGTESHVGKSAEFEENLGELLNTYKSEKSYAWDELWLRIGGEDGALAHIMHHIGTTGRTHYESSAVMAELTEEFVQSARNNDTPPDFVIRSHRHRHIKVEIDTKRGYGIAETTPGWQLRTPFAYRIPGGRITLPQFGGILLRKGDEEHYSRHKTWNIERGAEIVI